MSSKKRAFSGIAIGFFEDDGPALQFRKSKIPKKVISRVIIHGMSAVRGGEDLLGGLFGPLPIYEKPNKRFLIYSFKVKATNTKDKRIAKYGRICSIFLFLKKYQQRYILNTYVPLEKMVMEFCEKNWKKELDVTESSMILLFEKLNEIVDVSGIRAFSFGDAGLIEYADPQMVLDEGILAVLDSNKNKIYLYLPSDKFSAKNRIKAIEKMENINQREYNSQLRLEKIKDYMEFKEELDNRSIKLVK